MRGHTGPMHEWAAIGCNGVASDARCWSRAAAVFFVLSMNVTGTMVHALGGRLKRSQTDFGGSGGAAVSELPSITAMLWLPLLAATAAAAVAAGAELAGLSR